MRMLPACLVLALAAGHAASADLARASGEPPAAAPADRPGDSGFDGDPQPLPPAEARALFERALGTLDGTHTWRLVAWPRSEDADRRLLRRDARGHLVVEALGPDDDRRELHIDGEAWTQVDGGAWRPDPDAAARRDAITRASLADGPTLRALALQADAALAVRDMGPAVRRIDGCLQRLLAVGEPGPQPAQGRLELTVCVASGEPSQAEWIAAPTAGDPPGVAALYYHVDIAPLRAPGDEAGAAEAVDAVREPEAVAALARAVEALRGAERLEAVALAPVMPGTDPQPVRVRWQRDGATQLEMPVMGVPVRIHSEGDSAWVRFGDEPWMPMEEPAEASEQIGPIVLDLWMDADAAQAIFDSAADARLAADAALGTLRIELAGLPQPPVEPGQPPEAPERIVVVLEAGTHALREVIETYGGEGVPPKEVRTEHRPATFAVLVRD